MQNYASLQETHDQEEQGILFHHAEPTRSRWNHIEDLDSFFSKMYKYHQRHGFVCMLLQDLFELNQFVFVVCLSTYLIHGINYEQLFRPAAGHKPTLSDVVLPLPQCMANFTTLTWICLIVALFVLILKCLTRSYQVSQFWDIKQFYNTALEIKDSNLDNLNWHEVQSKIKAVQLEQQMCIHKRELTELDIYHRILRQENYIVAMVNKGLLPPRVDLPFLGECIYWSKALRYNIQGLLFWSPWSPFESPWHLREEYKKQNMRHELANQLGKQILWLSLINLTFAPLILVWQILYTFFNYAEVIKREPGKIGVRTWSLYSRLYLRHFNELDHELHARLTRAYRPATNYLSAFNSPIATVIAQHVGFLSGALFAVIVALTVYDEDVIAVENVITVMTGLGAVIAICRGIIPEETMVWCPESLLQGVVMHTHYLPGDWRGHAHTSKIREEFQQLFQYRVTGLLEELLSPILTPYFLWRWVYPRSLDIVDFFRNFTVSVVGVGDVCSFAQMDVKKHGNPQWQSVPLAENEDLPDQYTQAEGGKVELSLIHFTTTNPDWIPPREAQQFVDDVKEEIDPIYQDSDVMFFASFQNLLDNSSLGEVDQHMQSFMNIKRTATSRPPLAAESMIINAAAPKTAAWKAEGADIFGPISMRTSCLALHDRHYRRQHERHSRSLEETTPLLLPKSNNF